MSNNTIVDAGEKLGGAVKDDWANYQHKEEDAAKTSSVADLWPRPDWKELIAEIATEPEHTTESARELAAVLYLAREMAIEHQKRNGFAAIHYKDETLPALKVRFVGELQEKMICYSFGPDPDRRDMVAAVFGFAHYLAAGCPSCEGPSDPAVCTAEWMEKTAQKADRILRAVGVDPRIAFGYGIPSTPSEATRAYRAGEIDFKTYDERFKQEMRETKRMSRHVAFTQQLDKLLATDWPSVMSSTRRRRELAPLPKRERLARLLRTGPEHRHGRHIAPEEIIETFAIRGVEFGNWVEDGERQVSVNHTFDALHDLAEILGIEPRGIGRGRLGIGFGSRGRGASGGMAAAAHYEPKRVVINLTRMAGDGSLGHEMGHMFEHGLVEFHYDPVEAAKCKGRKVWNHAFPSRHWNYPARRPTLLKIAAVNAAFLRVMDTIMKAEPHKAGTWQASPYYREAQRLGNYWSAPLEMFARAFEAYVYDWLNERGRVSQYLVHGVEGDRFNRGYRGNPYPVGEQRERINAEMAALISAWRKAKGIN